MKVLLTTIAMLIAVNVYGGQEMSDKSKATIAITITIKANEGKADELANLLKGASAVVKSTEPGTLYWYSTQVDKETFTINDGFSSEEGVQAHFNGKVAAALKENAEKLVQGGWEQGVLPNIVRADILSIVE